MALTRQDTTQRATRRRHLASALLACAFFAVTGAVTSSLLFAPAKAHAQAAALKSMDMDASKPMLSFDDFKAFFWDDETETYMENPRTQKPFSEQEIRMMWGKMLEEKPELKPYLTGDWNLLPGEVRHLSEKTIQDIESTFHGLLTLQIVPELKADDLAREGRRVARVFQSIGPERMSTVIRSINKMDYYEMEVMFQAMGTSVEKVRPLLKDQAGLRNSLHRLPEGNLILKKYGGADGLLQQLRQIKLPASPAGASLPSSTRHAAYGPGGLFGVSITALAVLSEADDDIPFWNPADGSKPPATNPTVPYNNPANPTMTIVDESNVDDGVDVPDPEIGECGDADPTTGVNTNTDCSPEPVEENPSPDDQPAACPVGSAPDIKEQSGCPQLDTSMFESFSASIKEAASSVNTLNEKGVGDLGKMESELNLLSQLSQYSSILNGYPESLNKVRANLSQVEKFAELGGAIIDARSRVTGEDRAAFDLLYVQHRKLLGSMRRATEGATMIDKLNISGEIANFGNDDFRLPLPAMRDAVGALNLVPKVGNEIDKMRTSLKSVSGFCLNLPSKEFINMLSGMTNKTKDLAGNLPNFPAMGGIVGIIKIVTDIAKMLAVLQKIIDAIKTVQQIMEAITVVKQIIGISKQIGALQDSAGKFSEANSAMQKVQQQAAYGINQERIEEIYTSIDSVNKKVADYKAERKEQGKDTIQQQDETPLNTDVERQDYLDFMDTYKAINAAVNLPGNTMNQVSSDWASVQSYYAQSQSLLTDDLIGAFRNTNLQANAVIDISAHFDAQSSTRAGVKLLAKEMPRIINKMNGVPNIKDAMDKLLGQMGKIFAKLDRYRGNICVQIPNYTVKFCIAPFTWPISQANLYMIIGRLLQDNRYKNARQMGAIPFDYNKGLFGGLTAGLAYRVVEKAIPFGVEPVLRGVAGSLPGKDMKALDTPAVSALELNKGWLYRRACPRDWKGYTDAGLFVDEFDEPENMANPYKVKTTKNTGATIPQYARTSLLEPTIRPDMQSSLADSSLAIAQAVLGTGKTDIVPLPITCAPIKPAKCNAKNPEGCYSPLMRRLMVDACANQYITSQSLEPFYIQDNESKPGITAEFCQPLFLQPQDLCLKDIRGNCTQDPVRGVVRHEYDAYMYLVRSWVGTQMNAYLPDVHFPIIYDKNRKINGKPAPYADWTSRELEQELKKPEYKLNPKAMIVPAGIEFYYDQDPVKSITGKPVEKGWKNFFDKQHRWQMDDLITHPYEVIVDVTHPFSPRWDFEMDERSKYSRCTTFPGIKAAGIRKGEDKEICGSAQLRPLGVDLPFLGSGYAEQAFSFDPWAMLKGRQGLRDVVMEGSISCAGTPVDILRFREKNFDDCIMCRITTNERCLWSEVTQVTLTSIIITVIREVLYWIGYAIGAIVGTYIALTNWLGKRVGKLLRRIIDLVLFDPMGHNDKKSLLGAAKEKAEKRCKSKNGVVNFINSLWWEKEGCRRIIEFYQAAILILRAAATENTKDLGGNPYATGLFRLLTNSADTAQFNIQASIDLSKYQNMNWRKSYRKFRKNQRSEWIEMLRPFAEEFCEKKMKKGKSPTKCGKAKRKLKKAWKGMFKKGKKAVFKGLAKLDSREMKIPMFCKTDRTKQARKMYPPCSTRFNEADRDENFCKKGCAVSITDCCNELARPLIPLNKLRLVPHNPEDDGKGKFGEGMSFTEYFGTNRPYMAMWDTGTEWGGSTPRKDGIDYYKDAGAYVHIGGVGRANAENSFVQGLVQYSAENSCKIGGWGKSLLDPKKFGEFPEDSCIDWSRVTPVENGKVKPNPLTSWTELKLYQARTFRYFRLNCLGQYEKLFKPYTMEDIVLKANGGVIEVGRDDSRASMDWPLAHRGFLWDSNPKDRFPNFGVKDNKNKPIIGLDKAQPGDIIYLDADAYKEAYTSDPEAANKYAPMMGIVTNAQVGKDFNADAGNEKTDLDASKFTVNIWQANSGINPDSCGITEMMGFGRTRTVYRSSDLLLGQNIAGVKQSRNRFTVLEELQQKTPKIPVYTTLCHLDPMLRYCTLNDEKAGVNLWDHVRIYRPKTTDYRGGCMVRPTVDTPLDKKVDINKIPLNKMHEVPEDDIRGCMNEGRDPPKDSQGELRDKLSTPIISSLCSPGYAGRSSMLLRIKPIGKNAEMAKLFPILSYRSDLRAQGCPRFANDTLMPLKLKVKVNLNINLSLLDDLKSVHDRAIAGYNGLSALYGKYRSLPKTTMSAAKAMQEGRMLWMPCGGGIPLAPRDDQSSADASKTSWQSMTPPYATVDTHAGDVTGKGTLEVTGNMSSPIKLFGPVKVNRDPGSGTGNTEDYFSSMTPSECEGFSIPGLKTESFNMVVPPCLDAKECSIPTGIKEEKYDVSYARNVQLNNGNVMTDGKMTLTTPKDTLMQLKGPNLPITLTFPNGVSFKHECKQMVTLNGYNKVRIFADGRLKVVEGETQDQNEYYPVHNDLPTDPTYTLRPLGAVVFPKGYAMPMDGGAKIIPAINRMPSALDEVYETQADSIKDLRDVVNTKPRFASKLMNPDGESSELSYKKDDPTLNDLVAKQDADTNDICREQSETACLDGVPPAHNDLQDALQQGGAFDDACSTDPGSYDCAVTQGACAQNDESDACVLQNEDICVVMPDSKGCKDQKDFCAEVPDYYVCKNKDSCSGKMGDGTKDDWENCYFENDVSCPENPGNAICAAEQSFCDKYPDNYMCGGEPQDGD